MTTSGTCMHSVPVGSAGAILFFFLLSIAASPHLTAQETDPATIVGTIPVTDTTEVAAIETVDEAKVREAGDLFRTSFRQIG